MDKDFFRRHDLNQDADFVARILEYTRKAVAREILQDLIDDILDCDLQEYDKIMDYFKNKWGEKYQEDIEGPTDW